ncbi:MAG TPA: hypothetical protein VIH61_09680 [Waddliaceae bacterium]
MDAQLKDDIELLLNIARDEIINAEGCHKRFNAVAAKYHKIAHRVYKALDAPSKKLENYHNKNVKAVLLDPWTILNRARTFSGIGININFDDPEFWNHADVIKTLIDYLALTYLNEDAYASATGT